MRKILAISLFVLATLTWSLAQNPGATPPSAQQPPSATPQAPDANQQTPPSAGANPSQPGAAQPQQGASANATIMEGCLGGSGTDYTLTDKAGTTYKLNFPATANLSTLSSHVGESVRVLGDVTNAGKAGQSSINASKIGRGTGTCPAASSAPAQPQTPKP
jgi:hypothetical protein